MNDPRVGAIIRALRRRRGWRQSDLARSVDLSQPLISKLERGEVGDVTVDTLRAVTAALDATLFIDLRWRGAEVDRLLDEKHARVLGASIDYVAPLGWATEVEISYSVYGERGSIDLVSLGSTIAAGRSPTSPIPNIRPANWTPTSCRWRRAPT